MIASKIAFEQKNRPSLVLLTRQSIPVLDRNRYAHFSNVEKGGYIISDSDNPDVLIFATGSEVWVALEVKEMLSKSHKVKVINLCCWELFEEQEEMYKKSVLDCHSNTLLVSIEAGTTDGWQKFTGRFGLNIGINSFGESGPGAEVAEYFGITPKNIFDKIIKKLDS